MATSILLTKDTGCHKIRVCIQKSNQEVQSNLDLFYAKKYIHRTKQHGKTIIHGGDRSEEKLNIKKSIVHDFSSINFNIAIAF